MIMARLAVTTPLLAVLALQRAHASEKAPTPLSSSSSTTAPPLLFLHFHKAGGTSACKAFKAAGLRRSPEPNCNCRDVYRFIRAGDAATLASRMKGTGRDVCAIEKGAVWPTSEVFFASFAPGLVARGIAVATILRDPWSRFRSSYERVLWMERHEARQALRREKESKMEGRNSSSTSPKSQRVMHTNLTIEEFASNEIGGQIPNVRSYSCFNQRNFYVRTLIGRGQCDESAEEGRDRDEEKVVEEEERGERQLATAQSVLRSFAKVMILEAPDLVEQFDGFLGRGVEAWSPTNHHTNNRYRRDDFAYSSSHEAENALPPVDYFEATFRAANALDERLYAWAARRQK